MAALRGLLDARSLRALEPLGITTVEGLLGHYPRRYEDRGKLTDLGSLRIGDPVTVLARVGTVSSRALARRPGERRARTIAEVVVTDGSGELLLTFFNQEWRVRKEYRPGRLGLFAGTVGAFKGTRQLLHPRASFIDDGDSGAAASEFADRPIPVYPTAGKVDTWMIEEMVRTILPLADEIPEPLDEELRTRVGLVDLPTALRWVHHPADWGQIARARDRLRWDEAFETQVVLAQRRAAAAAAPAVPRPGRSGGLLESFDTRLPFALTAGQQQIGQLLGSELAGEHPMHRLLQGEVGSGKTVVALRAMLQVVDSGGQAALLAPTEVLAAQHARSIATMLGPLAEGGVLGGDDCATRIALLTGSLSASARRAALLEVASGSAGIVVGTHALLAERVAFADLGMVVIDEQHRFGVEQRAALAAKAARRPHTLVMTATPIPRTVAMTVFGDLEVSTLSELPSGRRPVVTHVVPAVERPDYLVRAWARIREEVGAGRQAYVVCPQIDPVTREADEPEFDEQVGADGPGGREPPGDGTAGAPAAAVETVLPALGGGPLAGLRLGALTGRMAPADKDDVMARFADPSRPDAIDVLVSTTVIEVGVDVPNATVMVVLDADRFGVSQLHQLRGRVGRGAHAGLCLLVTGAAPGSAARERVAAVAATNDGFELSRYDLAARREGDVLGAEQSGSRRSLRLISVIDHEELILRARSEATRLVDADPELAAHPVLAGRVARLAEDDHAGFLEKG